jgi:hypothetical protein
MSWGIIRISIAGKLVSRYLQAQKLGAVGGARFRVRAHDPRFG